MFVCLATFNSWTIWEEVWTNRIPPQPHLLHGRCVRILQNPRLEISWQFTRKLRTHSTFCFCSIIDDFKMCVKTDYFVMIQINCDSLWMHIQSWQLTLDWMFQAHASMHQDHCPPVILGNSQNIATMPYFLLGILRWWSQPQATSFLRLCCWVVKLQSVANREEFPKMCKILPEVWSITAKFAWAWSSNDPPKQACVKYKRKHLFFQASNFSHPIFTLLRCHMDQASRIRWAFQLGRFFEVKALFR